MPEPKKGESEKDYVSRCIPARQHEGKDKDVKQSAAICYSMFKNESFEKQLESIFNEKNMAKPSKESPVPEPLKPFVKRLGKIDFSPLEKGKEIYLQWMSGGKGQPRGNLQVFFPLNADTYEKYVEGSIKDLGHPAIANAPNYEALETFIKSKVGDKPFYLSSYYSFSEKSFMLDEYMGLDPEKDLRPNNPENTEKGNFFIQVKSPNSPDAKAFGKIMDDEMYVYTNGEGNRIESVKFRNVSTDGEFDHNARKIR